MYSSVAWFVMEATNFS